MNNWIKEEKMVTVKLVSYPEGDGTGKENSVLYRTKRKKHSQESEKGKVEESCHCGCDCSTECGVHDL